MNFTLCRGSKFLATPLLVLLFPLAAMAQNPQLVVPFDGTEAFRNHLALANLQPVGNLAAFADLQPKETLLIVFGDLGCLDHLKTARMGGLKQFINDGGALLIASDRPDRGRLRGLFDLSISGDLPSGLDLADNQPYFQRYHKTDDCVLFLVKEDEKHPIFAQCKKGIATNRPSFIVPGERCKLDALCGSPPIVDKSPFFKTIRQEAQSFAVGSRGETNRVLILSGHSVFMNGMLAQQDNDNFQFTLNTLRWLTNGMKRKHCLLFEDNQIITEFMVPIGELKMPPLPIPTTRIINDLLRGIEDENGFNRFLLDNVPKRSILRGILATALLAMIFYGVQRVLQGRFRQDKSVPLLEIALAREVADKAPPMLRRQEQVLRSNNFLEPARAVASSCFAAGPDVKKAAGPPTVAQGSRWYRRRLQASVNALWALAYTQGEGTPLSADAFAKVVQQAAQVRAAIANGALGTMPA